ncbi:MAG: dihydroneopterin triphosphate pyrophosphatase [Planctomycetes bacterium ADurb.Bin412]|nr:MAG: dihydroneopterin triphosphate pyrophosphatase [Planctomycetes bacterium ADurb.Bin412]
MNQQPKLEIRQEIPVKSFSVCTYICRSGNGQAQYLLLKRCCSYMKGVWQGVTGRIEKNETAWQTALREIQEETGLAPDRLYSANTVETFYEATQNCISIIPIFVGFLDGPQTVRLSREHDEYRWLPADQAKELLLFTQQKQTIDYLEQEFIRKPPLECLKIEL